MKLPAAVTRRAVKFWKGLRYYGAGLYLELTTKNVFLWAQAIAFKVLVTVVPIVVLATGIVARVLRKQDSFAAVSQFIREMLPASQSQQLIETIQQLQNASGTIVGIGGIGLFLSAMSLFITLRIGVSNAFEQTWHRQRSLFGGYLFDIRMVIQVGLLFLLTVGVSILLPSFSSINDMFTERLGVNARWIRGTWSWIILTTRLVLPLLITTAMFFQLYYFVPKPHPRKRSALAGAVTAAVLWEITKEAFTVYATYVGRFDRYGTEALGNTFGLIVAFVFWVYFSGIVLMIGAIIASLREHRHVTAGQLPGSDIPEELRPLIEEDQASDDDSSDQPAKDSPAETNEEPSPSKESSPSES